MTPSRARSPLPSNSIGHADVISRLIASAGARLTRHVPALVRLEETITKVIRFAGVGLASSFLYAVIVWAVTSGLDVRPDVSAVIGYAATIPFNFLLHRNFTFRSNGTVGGDVKRYAFAQALGIAVSYGGMAICVDGLGWPYACGIVAAIVLVPILTYLLLDRWAFAAGPRAAP